jgi:hypothetical protein
VGQGGVILYGFDAPPTQPSSSAYISSLPAKLAAVIAAGENVQPTFINVSVSELNIEDPLYIYRERELQ